MKKRLLNILVTSTICVSVLTACGGQSIVTEQKEVQGVTGSLQEIDDIDDVSDVVADSEPVSNETYAEFVAMHEVLITLYDEVSAYYKQGKLGRFEDLDDVLEAVANLIDEMGDVDRSEMTEKEAQEMSNLMLILARALDTVLQHM